MHVTGQSTSLPQEPFKPLMRQDPIARPTETSEPGINNPVTRLLVVGLSNIGDVILTTPVLERLHQLYPTARMDVVGDRRSSALFTHCPYLGRVIHRDKSRGWRGRLELIRELRTTRYDLVVDLRTDGMAYLLRARRRLTKWHRARHGPHAVEDHMSVIAAINPSGEIPPATIWLGEGERAFVERAMESLPGDRWLALAPGANWAPKTWPAEQFSALAKAVSGHFDALVLLGGKADRARCEIIRANVSLACVDLAGKTTLLEAAAALKHCAAFVGNDSGLGHMAAAMGIPTLTVFGPGRPQRYRPWGPRSACVVSDTETIADLQVDTVAEHLRALLTAP